MVKRRIANIILCLGVILSSFAVSVSPVFAADDDSIRYVRIYALYNDGKLTDYYYPDLFQSDSNSSQMVPFDCKFVISYETSTNKYSFYALGYYYQPIPPANANLFPIKTVTYDLHVSNSEISDGYPFKAFNQESVNGQKWYECSFKKVLCDSSTTYGLRLSKDIQVYTNVSSWSLRDIARYVKFGVAPTVSHSNGWETTLDNWYNKAPSIADFAVYKALGYNDTGYYIRNAANGSPSPSPSPSPSSTPTTGPGGGSGTVTFPDDYATRERQDIIIQKISDGISSIVNKISDAVSSFGSVVSDQTTTIKDALSDSFGKLKTWLSDGFDSVVKAIEGIPSAVSSGGKNIWDFLTAIVDALTHIADRIADGITSIIGVLFRGLGAIFVPSSDQVSELKSKVSDLKAETGFFGQSVDVVKDVSKQVSDGLVKGDNTIKWSDISLFDHVIIPSGSVSLDEYSSNLGFEVVHGLIKTLLSGILVWNTVLFVYHKFRSVFRV